MWRNFSFPCKTIVGKVKISPLVVKFQMSFIAIYAVLLLNLLFTLFCHKFLPQSTRFHVKKNLAQKYICGEKMTNIRSGCNWARGATTCMESILGRRVFTCWRKKPPFVLILCMFNFSSLVHFDSMKIEVQLALHETREQPTPWANPPLRALHCLGVSFL